MSSIAASGSSVVTANYSRLRRRVAIAVMGVLTALLVLASAGGLLLHAARGTAAPVAETGPVPVLPHLDAAPPVLAALSTQAPKPDPRALATQLLPLLATPALGQDLAAQVVDAASGDVLLDRNAAAPVTPASTAKLLTAVAALSTLDPERTLETTVVAGASPGEVVLVGGGDPTLSRTSPSQHYPGAAVMADLAKQVSAALPPGTPVTRIVVDTSLFTGPATAAGWQPGDVPSNYAAPVTAIAVDGARNAPGSNARSGQPANDAGQALATALRAPRAQVVPGTAPAGARRLGSVHSAPIARLVEQALSQSDNLLAESLARHVALARHQPATFQGAAQAVVGALKDAGLDVSGVELTDGSGLSRTDRLPPRLLADLFIRASSGKLPRAGAILSGLSIAGYEGTLTDRGDAAAPGAPGTVRGKTGTLLGVHALAGTAVTKEGRLLVFALVSDGATGSDDAVEAALDRVAAALAGCGCR